MRPRYKQYPKNGQKYYCKVKSPLNKIEYWEFLTYRENQVNEDGEEIPNGFWYLFDDGEKWLVEGVKYWSVIKSMEKENIA